MRRRRDWTKPVVILAALAWILLFAMWPGSSTFTVGTETTYVTGPLDKHGYVDYVTALNERLSQGVTPENNANVLIWQALGPHPEGGTMPSEYFQWLGIAPPAQQGGHLLVWQSFLKEHVKDGNERNALDDRMQRAARWPWTAKDEPEVAGWLGQNEKPLALAMEASRRSQYYNPLVPTRTEEWSPGLMGSLLPNVQRCRDFANALACRAMLRVAEGKVDAAWQDLLACHRLGRLLSRGGTLIEMLAGFAIDNVANKADVAFLDHAKLTSNQVLACLQDLRNLPPMARVADKIDLGDRFVVLELIMLTARHGTRFLDSVASDGKQPKGSEFWSRIFTRSINWDPALRNVNRWFDRIAAGLRPVDRDERVVEMLAIDLDLQMLKQQMTNRGFLGQLLMGPGERGEMMGNIMLILMLAAFDKVQNAADRADQEHYNVRLAFVLAAYQREHGRYPETLDKLAPKYADKIADDLFSSEPLIYQLEGKGYLLYSVGPNGIDDEGRGMDDEPRGDDLSIRMPVPEPRGKK